MLELFSNLSDSMIFHGFFIVENASPHDPKGKNSSFPLVFSQRYFLMLSHEKKSILH